MYPTDAGVKRTLNGRAATIVRIDARKLLFIKYRNP